MTQNALTSMSPLNNRATVLMIRGIFGVSCRCRFLGMRHRPRPGEPAVLAVAHLSHYDPVCASALLRRRIDWVARAEFYDAPVSRWFVEHAACVKIDRYGPALPGIREGLSRLNQDRLLGIFPDGEIMRGDDSVLRGASVKAGAAVLARWAAVRRGAPVPIVPCVVLGCDQFRRVLPWLPIKAGRLWIGLGEPIAVAPEARPGRATRREVSRRVAEGLRGVLARMQDEFDIPDEVLP